MKAKRRNWLELPVLTYSHLRSAHYWLQYLAMDSFARLIAGRVRSFRKGDPKPILAEARKLLKQDAQNIARGVYSIRVLKPESPARHFGRIPKLVLDGISANRRRAKGKTARFSRQATEFLDELPRYYRRNFHFQTDGYLSEDSARLYDHQVDLLFSGTADAMRRSFLPMMKKFFSKKKGTAEGAGLTFLEIGAGTGRTARFVRDVFPKAKIVVTDLSEPYLKVARDELRHFSRMDFIQADGADLPFQNEKFDAVYSVFLFHELPLDARKKVLSESKRVLKKGGFLSLVDSIQSGDSKLLDPILEDFPKDFHEPFYRNYIAHPMEKLLKAAGLKQVKKENVCFSKVAWGIKPA